MLATFYINKYTVHRIDKHMRRKITLSVFSDCIQHGKAKTDFAHYRNTKSLFMVKFGCIHAS